MGIRRPYNRPLDIVGHAGMTDIIICLRDILLSLYATNYYLCTRHIIIYVRDILLSMYETYYYLCTRHIITYRRIGTYVFVICIYMSPSIFLLPFLSRHRFPPISPATVSRLFLTPPFPGNVSRHRFPPPFPANCYIPRLFLPPPFPANWSLLRL